MREIVLVKVSGEDKPGLLHALMAVLAEYKVRILDLSQAVIHDQLNLSALVEIPAESMSAPIFKRLIYRAGDLGVHIAFVPVSVESYESWAASSGKDRWIITLLAREITPAEVSRIAGAATDNGLNCDFITRLSGRISLTTPDALPRACVELSMRGTPRDSDAMRREFLAISRECGVDIAFQKDDLFRRNRRLIALDMDSTLIRGEGIDELAREAGKGEEVAAVTEAAMRGELDFKQSLTRRVACLAGLEEGALERVASRLPLTEGAERLITTLKRIGYTVAVLSGGFTFFGKKLRQKLDIDYLHANELEIVDGRLTGRVKGEIVDGAKKAALLREIAGQLGIDLKQAVAVGDGANDLPMLSIAGLGIAFHAKPVVREGAGQSISSLGLDGILYLLGLRDRDALGE
ncbi:MAG: phosphoserine phosphatase SerB [Thermodesulfobacteriota bacterium]